MPWIVRIRLGDQSAPSLCIRSSADGQWREIPIRNRSFELCLQQVFRLAVSMGWNGSGTVLIVTMPTIARILGLGDFYFFQYPGKKPWQWVLAYKPDFKMDVPRDADPNSARFKAFEKLAEKWPYAKLIRVYPLRRNTQNSKSVGAYLELQADLPSPLLRNAWPKRFT